MNRKIYKRYFTILELLVVITIITILASLLLPALKNVKERGKQVTCISNQKQLGTAFMLYLGDNSEIFPYIMEQVGSMYIDWGLKIAPYCTKYTSPVDAWDNRQIISLEDLYRFPGIVYFCPSGLVKRWGDVNSGLGPYSGNYTGNYSIMGYPGVVESMRISALRKLTQNGILWDGQYSPAAGWFGAIDNSTSFTTAGYCHLGCINILYADGHVKSCRYTPILPIAYGGNGSNNNLWD